MPAVAARFAPFVILTLIAAGCAIGPARLLPSPEVPTPVRQVLPNGVRVIVQDHRASDVTALQLWVRAGGRDEAASERFNMSCEIVPCCKNSSCICLY